MNMIGLLLGILAAFSVLASAGCQPAAPKEVERLRRQMTEQTLPKVEVTQSSLRGVWYGACARDVERDELFRIDTLTVTADYIDQSSEFYSDSNCTKKYFFQSLSGLYTLEQEKISIKYSRMDMTPKASIILTTFNLSNFCGIKDWKMDELRSFSDSSVCGYPASLDVDVARYGDSELVIDNKKYIKTESLD